MRNIKNWKLFTENNSEYDKILDLYNEVGLKGMTPEQIKYLKSGGKTELPIDVLSLSTEEIKKDAHYYKMTNKSKYLKEVDLKELEDIKKALSISKKSEVLKTDYYDYIVFLIFEFDKKIIDILSKHIPEEEYVIKKLEIDEDGNIQYVTAEALLHYLDLKGGEDLIT